MKIIDCQKILNNKDNIKEQLESGNKLDIVLNILIILMKL